MSLTEITRNCFQSGISAQKVLRLTVYSISWWLALCKDFVNENPILGSPESVASGISNSVLFLYRSYPADSSLNKYLVYALKDGILPLHVYVATFLSAARSADFHSGATLDFLCDLALRTHEESSQIPPPALLSPSASPLANLETVQDALCLVQTSHTMILNYHHHKLVQNSERLLSHLLSYNTDVSQMTITQVWLAYSTTIDIMRVIQLDAQVRVRLKQFAMELNRVIQDDAKAAREAQMMQSMQVAKQSVGSLNSETDVVSLGLLWQYLVKHRARDFGAGNTEKVVALLVSAWRWSSWTAPVFCTQVFVSLFTCLTSCPTLGEPALWRAFILGRVPSYLAAFQKVVSTDQGLSTDLRTAFRQGIRAALRRQDLLVPGDHFISQATGSNGASDGQTSFARKFVQQLLKADLIEQTVVQEVEPLLGPSAPAHESQDMNVDLTCDFDVRLAQDPDLLEANHWLDRIWKDENSHRPLAALVLKRFELSSTGGDVEPFGRLCQLLYTHRFALDLVSLHVKVSDLVFYALSFLEAYDCESVGDPQTGVSQVGNVVLFLQYTIIRFQFEEEVFTKDGQSFSTTFLRHTDEVLPIESAQLPETAAFHSWFKALFDSSSEGIEDSILRQAFHHP
ncbi:hypothetical protein CC1G_06767 [Coprinopsis cinerea okayama7|uniref:Mediator complex subunit 5 n=1 Tax=Coprinopsis cinerea (strain Okayama-7 / 130 / ATCC MYA-4618 / FGSC 9003) TaxID=240176 RepID=A8N1K8_COPC7|nr:hypothetical protein CC1G_06767 [Coprinopsis cinerea okayama7\|eukprot:XP_001828781.2 hypothetical protein CC1G_06767 [Coprinopsis cinerea okayama7\